MIFQLKDQLNEHDFSNILDFGRFSWFVYHYIDNGYDGNGYAAGWVAEECKIYYYDLSHCSCYGPLEAAPTKYTATEFFTCSDNALYQEPDVFVKAKVAELLGVTDQLKLLQEKVKIQKDIEVQWMADRVKRETEWNRRREIEEFSKYYKKSLVLVTESFEEGDAFIKVASIFQSETPKTFQVNYSHTVPDDEFTERWKVVAKEIQDYIDPNHVYTPGVEYIPCASD